MKWNSTFLRCPRCKQRLLKPNYRQQGSRLKNAFKHRVEYYQCPNCENDWVLPDNTVAEKQIAYKFKIIVFYIIFFPPIFAIAKIEDNSIKNIALTVYALLFGLLFIKLLLPEIRKKHAIEEQHLLPLNQTTLSKHPELTPRGWAEKQ